MQAILDTIYTNLIYTGIGVGIFLMFYLANMCFGAWKSVKIEGLFFDWSLILESCLKYIIIGVGLILLTTGVTVIIPFANLVGIPIDTKIAEGVNMIVILGSFLTASFVYGSDAIKKLKTILGLDKTDNF